MLGTGIRLPEVTPWLFPVPLGWHPWCSSLVTWGQVAALVTWDSIYNIVRTCLHEVNFPQVLFATILSAVSITGIFGVVTFSF